MSNTFNAECVINARIQPPGGLPSTPSNPWYFRCTINYYGADASWDFNDVSVGDAIIIPDENDVYQRLVVVSIVGELSPGTIDVHAVYDDTGVEPADFPSPTGGITTTIGVYKLAKTPSIKNTHVDEPIAAYVNAQNTERVQPQNAIQGQSGFAAHELDGVNNDVNSYIEWDSTDQTHYHRVEPQQAGQDLDIKVGFQFPSYFIGIEETGTVFQLFAKNTDVSGNMSVALTALVDTDGTEFPVTGESVLATNRTEISLDKSEIEAILNPGAASSSSSGQVPRVWDSNDAGAVVYARFKLTGDIGDKMYLDADNAFMYIQN